MNKVELDGFIGKEPQIRSTKSGKEFATFSLATNESYKNASGTWIENTTWHNIVLWNEQYGEVKDNLKTGLRLHIEGRIVNRSYEDKSGAKRYISEVVAYSVEPIEKTIATEESK